MNIGRDSIFLSDKDEGKVWELNSQDMKSQNDT